MNEQELLIKHIKTEVGKMAETSTKDNLIFDLLEFLLKLKPIEKNQGVMKYKEMQGETG